MRSNADQLRRLLNQPEPIVAPGAFDALSALLIQHLGFGAAYLGGFASAAQIGIVEPFISLSEQVDAARMIKRRVALPLIVDGHAAFGDAVHTTHMVREFEDAGVAAIHIEDAVYPKRVSYFRNIRHAVPITEMIEKIRYAKASQISEDFVLIARTEAREAVGGGLDEVRRRLTAYAEAGADALMPMVWDPDEAAQLGSEFGELPMVWIAMSRKHKWPELSPDEAAAIGYKIVLYPTAAVAVASQAVLDVFGELQQSGRTGLKVDELIPLWDVVDGCLNVPALYGIEDETTEKMSVTVK